MSWLQLSWEEFGRHFATMSDDGHSPPGLPLLPDRPGSPAGSGSPQVSPGAESLGAGAAVRAGGRVANKVCRVCGDKALGYNFNVVTCESCKAFFRRNAVAEKPFRCPFSDNCEVNVISRRMCQKCRLRKCFEVGMKKEWILSEEAKRRKRPKKGSADAPPPKAPFPQDGLLKLEPLAQPPSEALLEAKEEATASTSVIVEPASSHITVPRELLKKLMETHSRSSGKASCSCLCVCGFYPRGTRLGPPVGLEEEEEAKPACPALAGLGHLDLSNLANLGWLPADLAGVEPIDGLYQGMINAAINEEITAEPSQIQIPASPATPGTPGGSGGLTLRDRKRLEELIDAAAVFKEKLSKPKTPKESLTLTDVVNMTDVAVRRIIQMSKRIAGFRSLCQEDQIALLKGSCTEVMILQGLMTYDPETDEWKHGSQEIRCDVLKSFDGGDAYLQHKKYLSSFRSCWRTNETLMLVLMMVVLFRPSRAHVSHPAFVQQQQDLYYGLLQRYLRSHSESADEAEESYGALRERIDALHSLNETLQKIFLDVNPKDVEPLLIEIFDLK